MSANDNTNTHTWNDSENVPMPTTPQLAMSLILVLLNQFNMSGFEILQAWFEHMSSSNAIDMSRHQATNETAEAERCLARIRLIGQYVRQGTEFEHSVLSSLSDNALLDLMKGSLETSSSTRAAWNRKRSGSDVRATTPMSGYIDPLLIAMYKVSNGGRVWFKFTAAAECCREFMKASGMLKPADSHRLPKSKMLRMDSQIASQRMPFLSKQSKGGRHGFAESEKSLGYRLTWKGIEAAEQTLRRMSLEDQILDRPDELAQPEPSMFMDEDNSGSAIVNTVANAGKVSNAVRRGRPRKVQPISEEAQQQTIRALELASGR